MPGDFPQPEAGSPFEGAAPHPGVDAILPDPLVDMVAEDPVISAHAKTVNGDALENPTINPTVLFEELAGDRLVEMGLTANDAQLVYTTSLKNAARRARAEIEAADTAKAEKAARNRTNDG